MVNSYVKFGAACAILGAVLAAGASFALPERYRSVAIVRLQPEGDSLSRLRTIQEELLSRASFAEIIRRPAFDLYASERALLPMEDVIQGMQDRDFKIEPADSTSFRISFRYPDRYKARAVVGEVVARILPAGGLQVVTQPTLPDHTSEPDRLRISAIGLGAGLALGLLFAFLQTRPLRWTLVMAASAVAGCGAAFGVSLLLPDSFAWDQRLLDVVVLGGLSGLGIGVFRLRTQPANGNRYLRLALTFGFAAAILAGFASFAIPEPYVSSALIRAHAKVGGSASGIEAADRLREVAVPILRRDSLTELIQRPSLDLYRAERSRRPMEDIVREVRERAFRIVPAAAPGLAGIAPGATRRISFEYSDAKKAQTVAQEFVTKFVEQNVNLERKTASTNAIVIDVVEQASLPESAVYPNRIAFAASGLIGGVLLGLVIAVAQHPPARPYLKRMLAAGAAGAAIALLVSFGIPNRYASSAVLRLETPSAIREAAAERLQQTMLAVSGKAPVVRQIRERNLRFESVEVSDDGRTTAFRIACENPDRQKAWGCVQELVGQFLDSPVPSPGLEVLDAATLPQWPSFPNRLNVVAVGLFVGLGLGLTASILRRPVSLI
uniref:Lipopolysaccharide biosynthesis n=1 Tax=Solibacter usitatus (strain Ellin6076) TaxID=234267 RepID=Q02AJ8_SOLUE